MKGSGCRGTATTMLLGRLPFSGRPPIHTNREKTSPACMPSQNLPWRNIPTGARQHGREGTPILKAAAIAAGLASRRPSGLRSTHIPRIRPLNESNRRTVTVYAITSLNASQATAA